MLTVKVKRLIGRLQTSFINEGYQRVLPLPEERNNLIELLSGLMTCSKSEFGAFIQYLASEEEAFGAEYRRHQIVCPGSTQWEPEEVSLDTIRQAPDAVLADWVISIHGLKALREHFLEQALEG